MEDRDATPADGVIRKTGETFEIVFVRRLKHPIEKVWAALTVPERIADWFTQMTFTPDLRLGAAVTVTFEKPEVDGRMVALDPPRLLAWTWPHPDHPDSVVRCELASVDGGCVLTFSQGGMSRKHLPGVCAGWHTYLEGLGEAAAGRRPPEWTPGREKVHADRYTAKIRAL